jgi:hypothetical protein
MDAPLETETASTYEGQFSHSPSALATLVHPAAHLDTHVNSACDS